MFRESRERVKELLGSRYAQIIASQSKKLTVRQVRLAFYGHTQNPKILKLVLEATREAILKQKSAKLQLQQVVNMEDAELTIL